MINQYFCLHLSLVTESGINKYTKLVCLFNRNICNWLSIHLIWFECHHYSCAEQHSLFYHFFSHKSDNFHHRLKLAALLFMPFSSPCTHQLKLQRGFSSFCLFNIGAKK